MVEGLADRAGGPQADRLWALGGVVGEGLGQAGREALRGQQAIEPVRAGDGAGDEGIVRVDDGLAAGPVVGESSVPTSLRGRGQATYGTARGRWVGAPHLETRPPTPHASICAWNPAASSVKRSLRGMSAFMGAPAT